MGGGGVVQVHEGSVMTLPRHYLIAPPTSPRDDLTPAPSSRTRGAPPLSHSYSHTLGHHGYYPAHGRPSRDSSSPSRLSERLRTASPHRLESMQRLESEQYRSRSPSHPLFLSGMATWGSSGGNGGSYGRSSPVLRSQMSDPGRQRLTIASPPVIIPGSHPNNNNNNDPYIGSRGSSHSRGLLGGRTSPSDPLLRRAERSERRSRRRSGGSVSETEGDEPKVSLRRMEYRPSTPAYISLSPMGLVGGGSSTTAGRPVNLKLINSAMLGRSLPTSTADDMLGIRSIEQLHFQLARNQQQLELLEKQRQRLLRESLREQRREYREASPGYRDVSHGYREEAPRYEDVSHGYRDDIPRYEDVSHGYREEDPRYRDVSHGYREEDPRYRDVSHGYREEDPRYRDVSHGYQEEESPSNADISHGYREENDPNYHDDSHECHDDEVEDKVIIQNKRNLMEQLEKRLQTKSGKDEPIEGSRKDRRNDRGEEKGEDILLSGEEDEDSSSPNGNTYFPDTSTPSGGTQEYASSTLESGYCESTDSTYRSLPPPHQDNNNGGSTYRHDNPPPAPPAPTPVGPGPEDPVGGGERLGLIPATSTTSTAPTSTATTSSHVDSANSRLPVEAEERGRRAKGGLSSFWEYGYTSESSSRSGSPALPTCTDPQRKNGGENGQESSSTKDRPLSADAAQNRGLATVLLRNRRKAEQFRMNRREKAKSWTAELSLPPGVPPRPQPEKTSRGQPLHPTLPRVSHEKQDSGIGSLKRADLRNRSTASLNRLSSYGSRTGSLAGEEGGETQSYRKWVEPADPARVVDIFRDRDDDEDVISDDMLDGDDGFDSFDISDEAERHKSVDAESESYGDFSPLSKMATASSWGSQRSIGTLCGPLSLAPELQPELLLQNKNGRGSGVSSPLALESQTQSRKARLYGNEEGSDARTPPSSASSTSTPGASSGNGSSRYWSWSSAPVPTSGGHAKHRSWADIDDNVIYENLPPYHPERGLSSRTPSRTLSLAHESESRTRPHSADRAKVGSTRSISDAIEAHRRLADQYIRGYRLSGSHDHAAGSDGDNGDNRTNRHSLSVKADDDEAKHVCDAGPQRDDHSHMDVPLGTSEEAAADVTDAVTMATTLGRPLAYDYCWTNLQDERVPPHEHETENGELRGCLHFFFINSYI